MRKNYIMPQVEAMNINATCDLLVGSPAPVPGAKSLPVVNVNSNIIAE